MRERDARRRRTGPMSLTEEFAHLPRERVTEDVPPIFEDTENVPPVDATEDAKTPPRRTAWVESAL